MESKVKQFFLSERFRCVLDWIVQLTLAVLFAFFINQFVLFSAHIPSGSMEKTMMVGDRLFAYRLSYLFSAPKRFDIAVFRSPSNPKKLLVKRVIGLPGEKLEIKDGKVYINDSNIPLRDDFVNGTPVGDYGPFYIPEDSYFMLGDNRNDSFDSKNWGYVPIKNFVGKPVFRYYPGFKIYH